jgi:DNA-binding PadR family transcriptional regulator
LPSFISYDIVHMNYMRHELGIWEIAVLALLREASMHPYQMQCLLRLRHKDELLALKRGSLYHAIGRLVRDGLIKAIATERNGRRPERTNYRITPVGKKAFVGALRQIVATPRRESSEFMAAMSFLVHLTPAEALPRLEERCSALDTTITSHEAGIRAASAAVDRINLVESEYLLAIMRAERDWVRGLAADIRTGKLEWNLKDILKGARADLHAAARVEE